MTEHQRLLSMADLFNEINIRYQWLIENDNVWNNFVIQSYYTLFNQNRAFMQAILNKIGPDAFTIQTPVATTITPAVRSKEENEDADLDIMMKVEVTLCEICDLYDKAIKNNPLASEQLKAFYKPFNISHVSVIKSSRRIIYSYC